MVFKQPLDFASPLAYNKNLGKSNTKLNIVHNLHGKDSVIDTHSIENFAPTPKEVVGDVVKVERRTLAGSVVKGAGHIAGVGRKEVMLSRRRTRSGRSRNGAIGAAAVSITHGTCVCSDLLVADVFAAL